MGTKNFLISSNPDISSYPLSVKINDFRKKRLLVMDTRTASMTNCQEAQDGARVSSCVTKPKVLLLWLYPCPSLAKQLGRLGRLCLHRAFFMPLNSRPSWVFIFSQAHFRWGSVLSSFVASCVFAFQDIKKRTEPKMGFARKASIIFAAAATKTPN